MERKVWVILAVLALVLVIDNLPAQPPHQNPEKEVGFRYEEDWWFESASLIMTADGRKFIVSYQKEFNISGKILFLNKISQEQLMFSPVDIVVGWGDTVLPENQQYIEIIKDGRLFYWRNRSKLKDEYVATHLLNIHAVPSNKTIDNALLTMNVRDNIRISGKVVEVKSQVGGGITSWLSSDSRTDAKKGQSEIVLISILSLNDSTYSSAGEVKSGKEIITEETQDFMSGITGILSKYGLYFIIIFVGLIVLYLFNTIVLRGYSAKKTDRYILTVEGRERSFEYLRSFENFGDDILVILSHVRSKGPTERSELEKKYGKRPVEYLLKKGYLELEKG